MRHLHTGIHPRGATGGRVEIGVRRSDPRTDLGVELGASGSEDAADDRLGLAAENRVGEAGLRRELVRVLRAPS
jgi:hypothetical protein